jgi:8-amino-3,8-dideoxy-alpha-D-manno-octulosonate transaminase
MKGEGMPGFEVFGSEEQKQVQDVLDTGVLMRYGFDAARNGLWKAKTFEHELAQRLGVKHCHLCASGTGALGIALAACGVGAGDEVIVPPFTFIATIEAVLIAGAVPVFAEIDETLCLSPETLDAVITPRTRAVLPVHMCGAMARIAEIEEWCRAKGLVLIEDACQAFGATVDGKAVGTFGQMGCFSFDPVKTITCGEGGAVITNDDDLYNTAQAWADHGHDHIGNDRGLETHPILGTNHRISELNAAVGLAQLRKLDTILEKQRASKLALRKGLAGCTQITFRDLPDHAGDSATFLSFFLIDETTAREAAKTLGSTGVDGCFYWYDNNWHYIRQWEHLKNLSSPAKLPLQLLDSRPSYTEVHLPQSDRIMSRTISMQIKLSWSRGDIDKRIEKMAAVLG